MLPDQIDQRLFLAFINVGEDYTLVTRHSNFSLEVAAHRPHRCLQLNLVVVIPRHNGGGG